MVISTRDINKPDEALIGSNFYDVFRHDGLGTWRQVPEVELLEERRNDNPGDLSTSSSLVLSLSSLYGV